MLGTSSKHIIPNGGLMVIYHGRVRKKNTQQKHIQVKELSFKQQKSQWRILILAFIGCIFWSRTKIPFPEPWLKENMG